MTNNRYPNDRYLRPGTMVRLDSRDDGKPEYGIVVHCWLDNEMDDYDCYVAFFGNEPPTDKPAQKPYVLRYLSASLTVIKPLQPIADDP